jgi:hypothetical protein
VRLHYCREVEGKLVPYVADQRFMKVLPTGIAIWSVAVAEASHFPDGMYIGCSIADALGPAAHGTQVFHAGTFEYFKLDFTK